MTKLTLTVPALGHQGDGVAQHQGKPLYVAGAAAGDVLELAVTSHRDHARGEIISILEPSPDRVEAFCQHFGQCGGCSLQHIRPEALAGFKANLVAEALSKRGIAATIRPPHTMPRASRRRVTLAISSHGDIGFHGRRSRDVIALSACPVLHPELEKCVIHDIKNIIKTIDITSISSIDLCLVLEGIDVTLRLKKPPSAAMEATVGGWLSGYGLARVSLWKEGADAPALSLSERGCSTIIHGNRLAVPAGAFLQASAEAQDWLTAWVLGHSLPEGAVLDLFAGIGGYSAAFAARGQRAHALELDHAMVQALRRISPKISAEKRDLFKHPLSVKEMRGYQTILLNPPRLGAESQCRELAKPNEAGAILYISCHPDSFARDAAILQSGGWRLAECQPLDQFIDSHHVEVAARFLPRQM